MRRSGGSERAAGGAWAARGVGRVGCDERRRCAEGITQTMTTSMRRAKGAGGVPRGQGGGGGGGPIAGSASWLRLAPVRPTQRLAPRATRGRRQASMRRGWAGREEKWRVGRLSLAGHAKREGKVVACTGEGKGRKGRQAGWAGPQEKEGRMPARGKKEKDLFFSWNFGIWILWQQLEFEVLIEATNTQTK